MAWGNIFNFDHSYWGEGGYKKLGKLVEALPREYSTGPWLFCSLPSIVLIIASGGG